MKRQRPSIRRNLELSTLAIERLWRLSSGPTLNTTYVPQADNLELAYGLLRTRLPDMISSHDLAQAFGIHSRHASYTLEAITELRLVDRASSRWFSKTELGEKIARVSEPEAYRLFITAVLRLPVVRRVLAELRTSPGRKVPKFQIEQLVQSSSNQRYAGTTVPRRATTVMAWMLWLENNVWFSIAH